jgi:Na+/melibiose symporter-like transporter
MLVQKLGGGIALFAMGFVLDAIGFVPDLAQSEGTVLGLRLLYGGFPLVISLAAAAIFTRYPLTRAVYADVRARLAERDGERGEP